MYIQTTASLKSTMELNIFWPSDLSHKSGLIYGWVQESCWIVCAVGPLIDLRNELSILGSLNYNVTRSSDLIGFSTLKGIPQIKHNSTGKEIQIILYQRPRSYLQFLSMDNLNLDLLSKIKIPPVSFQENVRAHIKYPKSDSQLLHLDKVLDLVRYILLKQDKSK